MWSLQSPQACCFGVQALSFFLGRAKHSGLQQSASRYVDGMLGPSAQRSRSSSIWIGPIESSLAYPCSWLFISLRSPRSSLGVSPPSSSSALFNPPSSLLPPLPQSVLSPPSCLSSSHRYPHVSFSRQIPYLFLHSSQS